MKLILICVWAEPAVLGSAKTALKFKYRISANSCRDNYSFFGLWVRQLFKGDNYSKEETINFYLFWVVYNVHR